MNSKKHIPLVALLSLGACSLNNSVVKPFCPRRNADNDYGISPKSSVNSLSRQQANPVSNYDIIDLDQYSPRVDEFRSSFSDDYKIREVLELPKEFISGDTSVDTGLVQIAAGDDSIRFRPLYSPAYELSLRHPSELERVRPNEDYVRGENYFTRNGLFELAEDDPQRVGYERSRITSALGKFLWGLDIFKPVKNVTDGARNRANQVVRDVFGSHAEMDYNGSRVTFGLTGISTERFDFEVNIWTDTTNLKNNGIYLEMVFPFGRINN